MFDKLAKTPNTIRRISQAIHEIQITKILCLPVPVKPNRAIKRIS